jgi:uncharacterized protein (TIGR02147 family)
MSTSFLNIFNFLDHKQYLAAYYSHQKKNDKTFTYRSFSAKVGVEAPSFLKLIIDGKRNLALKTIENISRAIGHSPNKAAYFKHMVLFGQARTLDEKKKHFMAMIQVRKRTPLYMLSKSQFEHYSYWYSEAIRELLTYYEFDPKQKYAYRRLGQKLMPPITASQARQAIRILLKLKLIEKSGKGCLKPTEAFISTGDEVSHFFIRNFHRTMIKLAEESQDRFPKKIRDVSSITMSISPNCFSLLKKEIQYFRKRVMELVKLDENPENVYQLNFQFFPLTRSQKKRNG